MSSPEHIRRGMRTVFTHLIRSSVLTKVLSASIIKQSHTATTLSCRTNTAVSLFRKLSEKANAQLDILSTHFAKQCHAIVAQRVRRALQISNLYSRLYDQKSLVHMLTKLRNTILKHTSNKSLGFLLSASLFSWDKYRITDEEMQSVAEDISSANLKHMSSKELKALNWQKVIDQPNLEVWRKPIENSHLYQYKVHGSFYDIPASAFFVIQVDLNYRKIWDKLVIKLDIVDRDEESGSEIVHWITHFPYPMYSREYVYRRRFNIDEENKLMVMTSYSVYHPRCPLNSDFVRVNDYTSKMVVKPHSNFNDNGFDYVLTYSDDPQAAFPMFAYNWMATTGVPEFVEKLHQAAKKLHKNGNYDKTFVPDSCSVDTNQYSRISSYC
ncbi:stAR-related lipid transfer protein 7, mitochondrial [Octopus sinensis]|uniref:Phosphatidylcholine transfer protein n=1 Tax=Octopus sinensis TaxID=2607531 RepID=A0A6P7T2K9_9MOLL|nr:stAR-related lipid transfer protein 7, mitochondrial [Octopus sinensis]